MLISSIEEISKNDYNLTSLDTWYFEEERRESELEKF